MFPGWWARRVPPAAMVTPATACPAKASETPSSAAIGVNRLAGGLVKLGCTGSA